MVMSVQATEDTRVSQGHRAVPARSSARALGVAKVKTVPEPDPDSFGAYLIEAMKQAGLSGAALSKLTAEQYPDEPVDSSTISNLRNGAAQPGLKVLRKIAPPLGRSLGEMLLAADPTLTPEALGMVAAGPSEQLPEEIEAVWARYKDLPTAKAKRALLNHTARSLTIFNKIVEEMSEFEEVVEGRRPPTTTRRR